MSTFNLRAGQRRPYFFFPPKPPEGFQVLSETAANGHMTHNGLMGEPDAATVMGWVQWDEHGPEQASVMLFTFGHTFHVHVRGSETNRIVVWTRVGGSFSSLIVQQSLLQIGMFSFAAVADPVNEVRQFWLNGELVGENALTEGTLTWDQQSIFRWFNHHSSTWPLGGLFRGGLVLNRAATEQEITEFHAAGPGKLPTGWAGLLARWNADEGDGTTINDTSGNNRHLTMSDVTWQEVAAPPPPPPPLPPDPGDPPPVPSELPEPHATDHKFVATNGDDNNAGTQAAPWRTIEFAFGQLQAGDVLWIRGNADPQHAESLYHMTSDPNIPNNGTEENPIIIAAYPGERPFLYRGKTDLLNPPHTFWELHDAATGTYRSVATDITGSQHMRLIDDNGEEWRLLPYDSFSGGGPALPNLMSTDPIVYAGPGTAMVDGRMYIRLQRDARQEAYFQAYWPDGWPAGSKNPNDYRIMWSQGDGGSTRRGINLNRSSLQDVWIEIHNLHIFGGARSIEVHRCRHWKVVGCKFHTSRGVLAQDCQNFLIAFNHCFNRLPPWVCWHDDKRTRTMAINGPTLDFNACTNFEVSDNWADHCWTAWWFGGVNNHNFKVLRNFIDFAIDDAVDINNGSSNVEVAYNYIISGTGVSYRNRNNSLAPGTVYVHHNVIDGASRTMWDWEGEHGVPFGSHNIGSTERYMRQIYQNTLLGRSNSQGLALGYTGVRETSDPPHSIFNNIAYQHQDHWISRHHRFDPSWRGDGNVYWRPGTGSVVIGVVGTAQSIYSVAQFDTYKTHANAYEGSEQASVFGVPGFVNVPGLGGTLQQSLTGCFDTASLDYRPNPSGPAASGAVNISDKDDPGPWPDAGNPGYRGALNPNSSDKWQGIGGFYLKLIVEGNIPPAIMIPE